MGGQVYAAMGHVLLKRDAEGVFSAALGELDSVLQAPGVQLFICAGRCPVEIVAVGVLEGHGWLTDLQPICPRLVGVW